MSDAGECVRCNARLPMLAAFCKRCGFLVERKSETLVPIELRRIADRHRTLMRVFALFVLAQLMFAIELGPVTAILYPIIAVICLILLVLLMVSVLSLTDALHFGAGFSVILTTFCLVPFVNLLIVIWLSRRATLDLRIAGIRVGFFGAKKHDVNLIAYVHRCRACGYDLRGLTSLKCPECGVAFSAPLTSAG